MIFIISMLLIIFALFNAFCILMIRQLRHSLKESFESKRAVKNRQLQILYELSNDNPLLREYVIYNAPVFLFPFAATTISLLNSSIQIITILIFIYSILKLNIIFLLSSVAFFFLSGYSGSRFNKTAMFDEAILNFSEKVPHYNKDYVSLVLHDFHEQYQQKILMSTMDFKREGKGD